MYQYIHTIDITSINVYWLVRVRIQILYRNKQYLTITYIVIARQLCIIHPRCPTKKTPIQYCHHKTAVGRGLIYMPSARSSYQSYHVTNTYSGSAIYIITLLSCIMYGMNEYKSNPTETTGSGREVKLETALSEKKLCLMYFSFLMIGSLYIYRKCQLVSFDHVFGSRGIVNERDNASPFR